jgi:hypothetical protein
MRNPMRLLAAFLGVVCGATTANAAPVIWALEGQVENVYSIGGDPDVPVDDPALTALGVVPGAPFTATIIVEPTTPDSDPSPDFASFVDGVLAMSFSAGSYSVSAGLGATFSQLVVNVDEQLMIANIIGPGPASIFNPVFGFEVVADVPGTFSDAMPIDPPPLASLHPFDLADPLFGFGTSFAILHDVQIRSSLTSWVLVPEPGLAALLVAAFAGILAVRSHSAG